MDTDGQSLDLSAPAFTIPGGRIGAFDTRNTAFGQDIFAGIFLGPTIGELIYTWKTFRLRSRLGSNLTFFSGSVNLNIFPGYNLSSNLTF